MIDALSNLAQYLPTVKSPEKPLSIDERLKWTAVAAILYFVMFNTTAFGVPHITGGLDFLQTITAARVGSLLTTGIGPLVLASIFLQLFVGAGLINLDLKNKEDKKKFSQVQKVLAVILAFVEAIIFVYFAGLVPVVSVAGLPVNTVAMLVVLQIVLGSLAVLFLDELVTKYGIGSGISLFIAAGVSFAVVGGLVSLVFGPAGVVESISGGGAEALPNALIALAPFLFTLLVFFAVAYAEGVKVEIPIAFQRVRGMVPKLPLKFFYVSNIPVIFASALIINVQLFAGGVLTGQYWDAFGQPTNDVLSGYSFEKHGILPLIGYVDQSGQLRDGLLYLFTPIIYQNQGIEAHFAFLLNGTTPILGIPEWVHALVYILFLALFSVLFGLFWIETANMDAKSVAQQLSSTGIQIPGFRRDPRMLESILNKHIFPLTVLGSFAVGLLAGFADLTGALGTGTGILLTVGILYRMYEQLEQMQALESNPLLSKLFGD